MFALHLYAKKWGFGKVFRRMIYSLFTEIDLANKKCAFRRTENRSGLFPQTCFLSLFFFTEWQKEGFSHQLHSESESVGEGISLGNAVHLVHAILELFQRFLLLGCDRAIQLLSVPGDQFQ